MDGKRIRILPKILSRPVHFAIQSTAMATEDVAI
jgi:hypothetical protein